MNTNTKLSNDDVFEYGQEALDVTRDGWFGGPADTERRYYPGIRWFKINGAYVSGQEFNRRLMKCQNDSE